MRNSIIETKNNPKFNVMKKITQKNNFKKILGIAALCFGLSNIALAQCTASYTYAAGSSGLVNFTNTSTGTTGGTTYHWNFGDGASSSAASPGHNYQYNGTYFANMSIWDSAGSCFDSTSQSITVTNGITCNIAASFSYSIGSNGQINFTNTSANVPVGATYYWNFGDGSGSNQSSLSHIYYYNGSYTVYLQIADSSGHCSNSTSLSVQVSNGNTCNMNAAFTYTLGSNGQVLFTNTSTGTDSMTHYTWSYNDGSQSGAFSNSHTYQYNGVYNISLNIGDTMTNCSSSISQTLAITNTANAPNCQAIIADSLFSNGSALFISYSSGTTPATVYNWDFGDGTSSSTENPNHTYANNGTYAVILHISDSTTGCSSYASDSVMITNALNGGCLAQFSFYAGSAGQVYFTNTSLGGDTLSTDLTWDFLDASATGHQQNPVHTYTANGTYDVSLQVTNLAHSCSSTYTAAVTVNNAGGFICAPTVSFNMHQDSLNPQPGVWQVSTYYSSQVTGAMWYWGDGSSTAGYAPTHTYASAGQYHICVTAYSSCGDSSTTCQDDTLLRMSNGMISVTVLNVNATGITTTAKETAQVSIYPNPSAGLFTLNLTNVSTGVSKAQINITNILGDVVYSTQEQVSNNAIAKEIDLQSTSNGAYFMKVIVGDKSYTSKIIINK
jgi:PKD repeat protein